MSVGRNEPCPCGSGRKYKNCHYAADRASGIASNAAETEKSPMHEIDNRAVRQIVSAIAERFPAEFHAAVTLHERLQIIEEFSVLWLAWAEEFDGRTAADWYVDRYGWSLSRGTAEWIDSQRAATFSIWQVREIAPGRLTLVDQLTGDERIVHEVALTEVVSIGLCLFARVVDHRGFALLAGTHPDPLRPLSAARIVGIVKDKLRRRRNVPRERLRDPKIAGLMLSQWIVEVLREAQLPDLQTDDGEKVLLTTDRWTFDPAERRAILALLLALPDAFPPPEAIDVRDMVFYRQEDETVIGYLRLNDSSLEVSTLSRERADLLRGRIELACGDHIRPGLRSHSDPMPDLHELPEGGPQTTDPSQDDESAAFARRYKEDYYARWLDEPVPALGDQTPREAAKTAAGRRKLIPLLDDLAFIEARLPENDRFDVEKLRKDLGLDRKR